MPVGGGADNGSDEPQQQQAQQQQQNPDVNNEEAQQAQEPLPGPQPSTRPRMEIIDDEGPIEYDEAVLLRRNEPAFDGPGVNAMEPDGVPFYGFEEVETPYTLDTMDMAEVLGIWESKHTQSGFDPVPVLKRLAEIIDTETEIYMRKDPDPFDERHPYRTDPSCRFGFLLKHLFRKDQFMNKLVNDYLRDNYFTRQGVQKNALELNILACRLILVIMPGLETSAVFQVEFDNLINRIYGWAEDSIEPLQSYATGLLAAAMEVTDIAVTFRELNTRLVPKMIKRLHMLQAIHKISSCHPPSNWDEPARVERLMPQWMADSAPQSPQRLDETAHNCTATPDRTTATAQLNGSLDLSANTSNMSAALDNSRDAFPGGGSAARFYLKMFIPIHPPTAETSQMLIMRYLTSMGEYQEFLGLVFENNAMQMIFGFITNLDRRDTCLAFEALKYLASLLCHKKFALEFIAHGGLELLLTVPRPSIAATGVSITLYYLAYSEDAMERICTMPKPVITDLVRYALWILGRSYDSGKCHATMFFGLSFQFKVILDEFDAQDGMRKLYNVISILKILNVSSNEDDDNDVNEDVECAQRQLVRHVCVALKRYMESHLFYKYNSFMHQQCPMSSEYGQNMTKATKATLEQISEQIRTLQENTPARAHWTPVDMLLRLGGITLLLKVIAFSYDWNNGGRAETVRSALDVLSICCVIPKVYVAYCDRLELPDNLTACGIYSILGAAAGDIITDADVQKAALAVLCHCVCSPIARDSPISLILFTASKKTKHNMRYSEELVEKVWESVCSNNGIIVLLALMQIKAPITDADCIRGMACRALAGLARSERVRQIISKLPLFASGQIQTLMRDPILQEKRAEHVIFVRYALELLERISGKTKPINNQLDPSLTNIHKANVVAQTKIQYNEQQLYQLIHDHLESKGLTETAQMLQREAGLPQPSASVKSFHQSPFDYKTQPVSGSARSRLRNRMQDVSLAINGNGGGGLLGGSSSSTVMDPHDPSYGVTPIKLVRKSEKCCSGSAVGLQPANAVASASSTSSSSQHQQRSLQKQITSFADADSRQADGDGCSPAKNSGGISLTTIVTEYLTNQHALCNNPMTTCPQFDLFTPHKCPDPRPNRLIGTNQNLTTRVFKAQAGYNTSRQDRRYVHSNFAMWRTIRSNDYNEMQFACCDIVPSSNLLVVGTQQGEARVFNINDGTELFSTMCHSYSIDRIAVNRKFNLVLTSCSWRAPLSVLWSMEQQEFVWKHRYNDDFHCEFSNLTQDKILGTQNDCAMLYDIATGSKISSFTPTIANQYTKNRATFCPTDELILSDGVLWDVRSGRELHKFDKLNQSLSGVFHPNGLEIIANSEVWDLRTFHLLQTVPVLNQCLVKFSPMRVIYGINLDLETHSDFDDTLTYDTSFKVLDAYNYSSIATIDVKRNIYDLSINGNGSLIALVENQAAYDSKQETCVKIYAVGMKKNEQQEEDDEEDRESDEDGSSSDTTEIFVGGNSTFPLPIGRRQRSRRHRRNTAIVPDSAADDDDNNDDDDDNDDDNDDDDHASGDDSSSSDSDDDAEAGWINIMSSSDVGDSDSGSHSENN